MTEEISDVQDSGGEGISRRRLIQRAGVVGVVAWTAPTVMSLRSPAFAASAPGCPRCTTGYTDAPNGCGGSNGCTDHSGGFCDTAVEGQCVCDTSGFVAGSEGCTSSAQCAAAYGPGYSCIHDDADNTTVCIAGCNGAGPNGPHKGQKIKTVDRRRR
jgi:hypothetical protein